MSTIPDHVGREAVRLLNDAYCHPSYSWPKDCLHPSVITVAKLLMNPPAPMTDPDEEAAKRVLDAFNGYAGTYPRPRLAAATEQMRKERESWEAGR